MEKPPLEKDTNHLESQESIKLDLVYDRDSDIWCLLYKGSNSYSLEPTKEYKDLVNFAGANPSSEVVDKFIDKFIEEHKIDIPGFREKLNKDWGQVEGEFHEKASQIFGAKLSQDVTAYLTINTRCPYNIESSSFFVSLTNEAPLKTIMHELLHFYTWQRFGQEVENKLGKEKYNAIKESLTVLLNKEFINLMPENSVDKGYPQHSELREMVAEVWNETKDIDKVWQACEEI